MVVIWMVQEERIDGGRMLLEGVVLAAQETIEAKSALATQRTVRLSACVKNGGKE